MKPIEPTPLEVCSKLIIALKNLGDSMQGPYERPSYIAYGSCVELASTLHDHFLKQEADQSQSDPEAVTEQEKFDQAFRSFLDTVLK